jgi:uncharacterized protein (TIGR02266 family)
VNHCDVARQAAVRVRPLLSPILRSLQETAIACNDPQAKVRLLRAAENVAETASVLYQVEHDRPSAFDSLALMVRGRDHMRTALQAVQAPEIAGLCPDVCAEVVAQALALVFVAASGGDWQGRDELRRVRRRALTLRVPMEQEVPSASEPRVTAKPGKIPVSAPPKQRPSAPAMVAVPPSSRDPNAPPPSSQRLYAEPSQRPPTSRRMNRRVTGRTVLEVDVGLVSDSNFYAGITMDVGTGGLFVATYQIRPVGTPIAVSMVLPDGHAVWAKGEVCWVSEPRPESTDDAVPGMGVRFTHIEPEDLAAIAQFCTVRPPIYHDTDG